MYFFLYLQTGAIRVGEDVYLIRPKNQNQSNLTNKIFTTQQIITSNHSRFGDKNNNNKNINKNNSFNKMNNKRDRDNINNKNDNNKDIISFRSDINNNDKNIIDDDIDILSASDDSSLNIDDNRLHIFIKSNMKNPNQNQNDNQNFGIEKSGSYLDDTVHNSFDLNGNSSEQRHHRPKLHVCDTTG